MTPPDLRTLVERLPKGPVGDVAYALFVYMTEDEIKQGVIADAILGYLVRWLGERGYFIFLYGSEWLSTADDEDRRFATPLEAAVEGVRVVWKNQ